MAKRATRRLFAIDAAALGKRLLGCVLVRVVEGERIAGRIVETEAYLGERDRASHAFGNRRTARTEPMFGKPGTSYVYFTYGMHFCMNVACAEVDVPEAVLIRALEPVEGVERMRKMRGERVRERDLCRGPARLCRALGIKREENGLDLTKSQAVWIEMGEVVPARRIGRSARIGVGYAGEWAGKPLRYFVRGSAFVSGGGGGKDQRTPRESPT